MIERAIYDVLDRYRKNPYGERFDGSEIIRTIRRFTEASEPVTALFPGCHGKIANDDLTLGPLPDASEYLCLRMLGRMRDDVRRVYPPGLHVIMVHEGHFYTGTPLIAGDEAMDEYIAEVRRMISRCDFVTSMALRDFFPGAANNEECSRRFQETCCPSFNEIRELMAADANVAGLYEHYARRIRDGFRNVYRERYRDAFATFMEFSSHQAMTQLRIWIGFRRLLKKHFGDRALLRFSSVYKSPAVKEQIALNYIPGHHLEMPSFNCVVQAADGSFAYMPRREAVQRGFVVSRIEGYAYFQAVPAATHRSP